MYTNLAPYYDPLYSFKDYRAEAEWLHARISEAGIADGASLLDVACGTGKHLEHLRVWYDVAGVDGSAQMLRIARERLRDVPLSRGDMRDFGVDRRFDVVTCLFSAIGYMLTVRDLRRALRNMAAHVRPGGLLVLEPWLTPEQLQPGRFDLLTVNEAELKIARTTTGRRVGRTLELDMHYLVATARGVRHHHDRHRLGVFTDAEYRDAFARAGLTASRDDEGLTGRGVYFGRDGMRDASGAMREHTAERSSDVRAHPASHVPDPT